MKSYQRVKKWVGWLLLVGVVALLCSVRLPAIAQIPKNIYPKLNHQVEISENLLKNAQVLQASGQYRRACGVLLESLTIPVQECQTLTGDEVSEQVTKTLSAVTDSFVNAAILRNLGDVLRVLGAIKNSQVVLQQSLAISQRLKSNPDISATLISLGNTQRALGIRAEYINNQKQAEIEYAAAFKYYQDATAISAPPIIHLRAQLNQLNLLSGTNLNSEVGDLPQQIQFSLANLPTTLQTIYAKIDFAQTLTCLNFQQLASQELPNYATPIANRCKSSKKTVVNQIVTFSWAEIAKLLSTAVQQAKVIGDKRAESYGLGQLGEIYEINQQWSSAEALTKEALSLVQSIQAWDIAYLWQWQLGRLRLNQADFTGAITAYTAAFDTLQSLRGDLVTLNPDIQFNFRDQIEPVYRQFVDLLLNSPTPSPENLDQARNVIEALQLAELENFFREACLQTETKQIDQIDRNAAVFYPIILKNRLAVILSLPGQALLYHSNNNLSQDLVDKTGQELRGYLKSPDRTNDVQTLSQKIYQWLIEPFQDDLAKSNTKTLVFVLDGVLRNLPMAALYDGQRYLVEKYAIALTPGLQLLGPKPLLREQINILIAGATNAPSFQKENLSPLPNVERELNEIRSEVRRGNILPQQKFIKTNLQNQINSIPFSIIHIATHGNFSSNLEQTYILDWNQRLQIKDLDSLLRLRNQNGSIPVELLVLSACKTATGDKRAALGLAGISVRAGARSTLATLWQVADASTAEIMIQFYRELKNSQIAKAEALRRAQLDFLNRARNEQLTNLPDADYTSPYYWLPFVLVGNWF